MSEELTAREREYLACETPMLSAGKATGRIVLGAAASLLTVAFSPGSDKADKGLMRTVREIRYTKYKKAVLRKEAGAPLQKDEKLLIKLNKKPFVLTEDTYDADRFTQQVYEEYMRSHENKE